MIPELGIMYAIVTFLLYVTKYNKMVEPVHELIDSCLAKHVSPQLIPDALKHHYTKLGLIGYEWMVRGFDQGAWTRKDFFFFSNDEDDEQTILDHYLKVYQLRDELIGFSQLMYQCRKNEYGESNKNIVSRVEYDAHSKTIQILDANKKDVNIPLDNYSDQEIKLIIQPWMRAGLDLMSRMTPNLRSYLQGEDIEMTNEEFMYHAQPFMPVSVVYPIDEGNGILHLVTLIPMKSNSKPMFVHPLTPNIMSPSGHILLLASIVDNRYFQSSQTMYEEYMQLLCLYRRSLNTE